MTATASPSTMRKVSTTLGYDVNNNYMVHLPCNRPEIAYWCVPTHYGQKLKFQETGITDDEDEWPSDDDMEIGLGYGNWKWSVKPKPANLVATTTKYSTSPKLLKEILRDLKTAILDSDVANFPRVIFFCPSLKRRNELHAHFHENLQSEFPRIDDCQRFIAMYDSESLTQSAKDAILARLKDLDGDCRVLFCTSGFGIGIDIRNFRLCVHYWCNLMFPLDLDVGVVRAGVGSHEQRWRVRRECRLFFLEIDIGRVRI